jgi:hypothetical protein
MSWALPLALGYYGESVAMGVAAFRRPLGCVERFGLSVGLRSSVRPLLGGPSSREGRGFLRMSQRRPDLGSQHLSRGMNQIPTDWSSSSVALPGDSLADEPHGR